MISRYIQIISIIFIIVYSYKKTKESIFLWILNYALFLVISLAFFKIFFPDIAMGSPTLEYGLFLTIVGVPFLILVVLIGSQIENRRAKGTGDGLLNITSIFTLKKDNIIFWVIIIIINLIAYLLDKQ